METASEKLKSCYSYLRERTNFIPSVALVLGSGLGGFADKIKVILSIDYAEIPGFPVSTVTGHKGKFIFGYLEDLPVIVMQGRVHYYEGYSMQDVVLPIRLMRLLGAGILFLTNAAGGMNKEYKAGDFMLLRGHISSFVPSPLIGANLSELGERFPDMSEVYDKAFRAFVKQYAAGVGIPLREGVYLQATGPNYETPEEIRMFGLLGADAVGMSTACEAMAARHAGMKVCAISCITNLAAGGSEKPLSHQDVTETADKISGVFEKLLYGSILAVAKENGK